MCSEEKDLVYKDAIYFSPHKFVGGVDSPGDHIYSTWYGHDCASFVGVLVAKKSLFDPSVSPHGCGGGTVFFVTPLTHQYFKEIELREEGGTPSIVGAVRAGLAVQLKEAVGSESIMSLEEDLCRRVFSQWEAVKELVIVGPHHIPRLPVFSFLIRHPPSGKFLHHNFVCSLLNDLFGIQARGGCSCAGPYAQVYYMHADCHQDDINVSQALLGIDETLAERYRSLVMEDR